jgi:Ser/Thr protein kinase RdoA (MazF antagonist)
MGCVQSPPPEQLSRENARSVAALVAQRHGLSGNLVELGGGLNDVFRVGDVVLRLSPGLVDATAQVAVARWLRGRGFEVPPPLSGVEFVDGVQVTLWGCVESRVGEPIDFEQLGEIVARLHQISPTELDGVVDLPFCDADWLDVARGLEQARALCALSAAELQALDRACERVSGWQELARAAPRVICHGDVHPQNVLMGPRGVVLLDWDSVCTGPPAFDHAALMTWSERWAGEPSTYRDFAEGYGADLSANSLGRQLAELRLLAATLNIAISSARNPLRADEARKRMRFWLGDPHAPSWNPA